jgi:hypothetical protein
MSEHSHEQYFTTPYLERAWLAAINLAAKLKSCVVNLTVVVLLV